MPEDEKTPKPDEKQDDPHGKDDDAPPDTDGEHDYKAGEAKWRAMSRKHEAQAKTNADAAKKLADMEDADKSELQKATDRAAAAEKLAAGSEARATRYEVAAELGIYAKHLKYLTGSTKEEIEESGKGILDDFPEAYGQSGTDADKKTPTRPKERLRSGAVPDEEPDETDPHKLAASVPRL